MIQTKASLVEFKIYGTGYPYCNLHGVKLLLNALQTLQINSVLKNNFQFVISDGQRSHVHRLASINEKGEDLVVKLG